MMQNPMSAFQDENYLEVQVNQRILFTGRTCTVKYMGDLPGKKGLWLGVEWDDGNGKHDGTWQGVSYFTTRLPTSGSFVRYNGHVMELGQTFLQAVEARYQNPVVLESTQVTTSEKEDVQIVPCPDKGINFEMVGFNKIARKQRLENLVEINLNTYPIDRIDAASLISERLPNVQSLDLSSTLLTQFSEIASLCSCFPRLNALYMNRLKLEFPTDFTTLGDSFPNVLVLTLNATFLSFSKLSELLYLFPNVEELHFGFNDLKMVEPLKGPKLRHLNLQNNALDLSHLHQLKSLPALKILNLQHNQLKEIPHLSHPLCIDTLIVSDNDLQSWRDVDTLCVFNQLTELRINRNPIYEAHLNQARMQVVGRIPTLTKLNGSAVSPKDREGYELYFLKIATEALMAEVGHRINPFLSQAELEKLTTADFRQQFPSYMRLIARYGIPVVAEPESDKVQPIHVLLRHDKEVAGGSLIKFRVLPNVIVRHLRGLIARQLRLSPRQTYLTIQDPETKRMEVMEDDLKPISYYNVGDGDLIYVSSNPPNTT